MQTPSLAASATLPCRPSVDNDTADFQASDYTRAGRTPPVHDDMLETHAPLQKAFWSFADATGLRDLFDADHSRKVRREAQAMAERLTHETTQALRSQGPSAEIDARFAGLAQTWGRYHETSVGLCEYVVGGHSVLWWALEKEAPALLLFLLRLYNQRQQPQVASPALVEIEKLLQIPCWADTYAEAQSQCLAMAAITAARQAREQALADQAQQDAIMQSVHDCFRSASSQTPANLAALNTLLEGACGALSARRANLNPMLHDPCEAILSIPSSTTRLMLAAMSDVALNRLLHYRMPSPPALVQMLPALSKSEANRLLLLYSDVLRERGLCLDDLKFVMPPELVALEVVWANAAEESDLSAADVQNLDDALYARDDKTDSWDTATLGSSGNDDDASSDDISVQSSPIVLWTQARSALGLMPHNHNAWADRVSLRDVARLLKLDEAVLWFDTDGQAPAHVRLERHTKPLIDFGPN